MAMAYAPLPKLVPIGSPRVITPQELANGKTPFAEVLKSEPVKRLLSQPNIVIRAIGRIEPDTPPASPKPSTPHQQKQKPKKKPLSSELNISIPSRGEHLLPSKTKGKSEISLERIKLEKRPCGHFEKCENIICDVNVEQYVDEHETSPIVAFNITDSEITAKVSKHCDNNNCDALSIDHNRCRSAIIRLFHCDKINKCDICGVIFKTRKSRIIHRNCTRKIIYQHNQIDTAKLLRERMRERELQMIESLRIKRNDAMDPLSEENILETLKKNTELIVIPKNRIQPEPIITITPIVQPSEQQQQQQNSTQTKTNNLIVNNGMGYELKLTNNSSIILPQPPSHYVNNKDINIISQKQNNINLSSSSAFVNLNYSQSNNNNNNNNISIDINNEEDSNNSDSNQYMTTVASATPVYPLDISEWVVQQSNSVAAQKQVMMPIRIVPIANLKSEPSALHQKQGVPRFCIVADSVPSQTFANVVQTNGNNSTTLPGLRTMRNIPIAPAPVAKSSIAQPLVSATLARPPQLSTTPTTVQISSQTSLIPILPAPAKYQQEQEPDKIKELAIDIANEKKRTKRKRKRPAKKQVNNVDNNKQENNNDNKQLNNVSNKSKKIVRKPRGQYVKRKKGEVKNFECEYCHKKFFTDWYFKCHLARHKGEVIVNCTHCDKGFTNDYDLRKHISVEHTVGDDDGELKESVDKNNLEDGNDSLPEENKKKEEEAMKDDDGDEKTVPKFKIINVNGVRRTSMKHDDDDDDDDDEDRLVIAEEDDEDRLVIAEDDNDDDYLDSEIDEPNDSDGMSDADMIDDPLQ